MSDRKQTITGQQAAIAQTALRNALGLAPEEFSISAFIGMISDEIEQLRAKGKTDEQISAIISQSVAVEVSAGATRRVLCLASSEARSRVIAGDTLEAVAL